MTCLPAVSFNVAGAFPTKFLSTDTSAPSGVEDIETMPDSLKDTLETILVVDDTKEVLGMVVRTLENANFHVLSAGNGPDALKLGAETEGKIHLVLSDVDMPEMSGPDLGQLLKKARPDLHVMLMSGGSRWKSAGPQLRVGLNSEAIYTEEAG
jgi:CheY-like chemotaxis protein